MPSEGADSESELDDEDYEEEEEVKLRRASPYRIAEISVR